MFLQKLVFTEKVNKKFKALEINKLLLKKNINRVNVYKMLWNF